MSVGLTHLRRRKGVFAGDDRAAEADLVCAGRHSAAAGPCGRLSRGARRRGGAVLGRARRRCSSRRCRALADRADPPSIPLPARIIVATLQGSILAACSFSTSKSCSPPSDQVRCRQSAGCDQFEQRDRKILARTMAQRICPTVAEHKSRNFPENFATHAGPRFVASTVETRERVTVVNYLVQAHALQIFQAHARGGQRPGLPRPTHRVEGGLNLEPRFQGRA